MEIQIETSSLQLSKLNQGPTRVRPLHNETELSMFSSVQKAYMTPDGKYLAFLEHTRIEIWNLMTNRRVFQTFEGKRQKAHKQILCGTSDSQNIFFLQGDKSVAQWNCKVKQIVAKYPHNSSVLSVVPGTNQQLWTATKETLNLWDLQNQACLFNFLADSCKFVSLFMSHDYLYALTSVPHIYIFGEKDGSYGMINQEKLNIQSKSNLFAVSPQRNICALSKEGSDTIQFVDLEEFKQQHTFQTRSGDEVKRFEFTIDQKFLIINTAQHLKIISLENYEELISIKNVGRIITSTSLQLVNGILYEGKFTELAENSLETLRNINQRENIMLMEEF